MSFLINTITPVSGVAADVLKVLSWPVKEIFKALLPILSEILEELILAAIDIISSIFESWLYRIQASLLDVIGYLELAARYLMGLDSVEIQGESSSFLTYVFHFSALDKIFLGMILIALPLAGLITIYKMVPKVDESEETQPISAVVRKLMLAVFRMLSLGAVVAVLLHGSLALINGIRYYSPQSRSSVPDIVFVSVMSGFADSSAREELVSKYLEPTDTEYVYSDTDRVTDDFENPQYVWVVIYLVELMCILSFAGLVFATAKRGFSLVVIYIFGPLFAALSVDNEDIFNRYKRQLFAQFFSFLSSTLSLTVFSVVSLFVGTSPITFSSDRKVDACIRCLMILLFVMSIDEVADMTVTLLSDVRFNDFANSTGGVTGVAMSAVASVTQTVSRVAGAVTSGSGGGSDQGSGDAGKNGSGDSPDQGTGGTGNGSGGKNTNASNNSKTNTGEGSTKANQNALNMNREQFSGPSLSSTTQSGTPGGTNTPGTNTPGTNTPGTNTVNTGNSSLEGRLQESNQATRTDTGELDERESNSPALQTQSNTGQGGTTEETETPSEEHDDNNLASVMSVVATPFVYAYRGVSQAASAVGNLVKKGIDKVKSGFSYVGDKVGNLFAPVKSGFSAIGNFVKSNVTEPIGKVWNGIKNKVDYLKDKVSNGAKKVGSTMTKPFRMLGNYVKRAADITRDRINKILKKK